MLKHLSGFFLISFLISFQLNAQHLKPGFDAQEFYDMVRINLRQIDTSVAQTKTLALKNFQFMYRSPEVGLSNRFDFFMRSDSVGVISLRGTVRATESWLENFYSAMLPAKGSLKLSDTQTFDYKLAQDDKAMVHVGWLIGLGSMAPLIVEQINNSYKTGVREFVIVGHSQGGALAFLLRSYLEYTNLIPKDIIFKTYCSAAPKPGNLFYAYDFDHINDGGWAFRVVNAADWVPETPVSIQNVSDFNAVNPFGVMSESVSKQPLIAKLYVKHAYKKMAKGNRKAAENFNKYLGKKMHDFVKKSLPQIQDFDYTGSFNYATAGTPVILMPDDEYSAKFIFDGKNIFTHHLFSPYFYLLKKQYNVHE